MFFFNFSKITHFLEFKEHYVLHNSHVWLTNSPILLAKLINQVLYSLRKVSSFAIWFINKKLLLFYLGGFNGIKKTHFQL